MNDAPVMAPCPFCADRGPELTTDGHGHYVACTAGSDCTARGPRRDTGEEAVDAWNATVPRSGPDSFEHWTCGTAHISAERTLRLIEMVGAASLDAMEFINAKVDEAGIANARAALRPHDDLPF